MQILKRPETDKPIYFYSLTELESIVPPEDRLKPTGGDSVFLTAHGKIGKHRGDMKFETARESNYSE